MKTCYDASTPPASPPTTDAVAIYAGGDTPHVWTDAEINEQRARYRVPVWVRSDPSSADVQTDVAAFRAWITSHGVPAGVLVMLDLETAVAPAYVTAFALGLAEWKVSPYGSRSTLFGNPQCAGYWTAHPGATTIDTTDLDGRPQPIIATQFDYLGAYDLSWIADDVPLWDTRPPAPPAPSLPALEEDDMTIWRRTDNGAEYAAIGGKVVHIDGPTSQSMVNAGAKVIDVSPDIANEAGLTS